MRAVLGLLMLALTGCSAQVAPAMLNAKILGVTRLRLQVTDLKPGYGPYVSIDSIMLCTN